MTEILGRIISKTSDGSVPVIQTFTYNMRNLLETATDTVGNAAATSVTRLYDSFGNHYSESVSSNNITKTVSRRMTDAKTYQFTYPDGKTLRKTATGSDLDSIEYNNAEIASYSRANGVLTAITKGQNLIETFSYNNWNMLDNHTVSNANADVYDMSYNYSRGWHLIEKADGIKNTSDKYAYDSYYRLKEVKYDFANNTAARTDSFFADGVHNIEQSTENGTTFAWGVDKLNRLRDKKIGSNTESAYGYDERNNMISEDRSGTTNDKTYIYDDLNRLIEVKDGSNQTIATYTYDAFNRRITKTVGNTTERYTYDDWNIVEISTNSNDYSNIIDSGTDRHIAIEVTANNTSTLYYFLTDERGNIIAISDGNGTIYERYRYRVYGEHEVLNADFTPKSTAAISPFLWGGSLYEPETNLYWMRNRYYHIDMHRFINQDPIGIWGDANNLGNGFAYVAGMVIEASDPTGLNVKIDKETGDIIEDGRGEYSYKDALFISFWTDISGADDYREKQRKGTYIVSKKIKSTTFEIVDFIKDMERNQDNDVLNGTEMNRDEKDELYDTADSNNEGDDSDTGDTSDTGNDESELESDSVDAGTETNILDPDSEMDKIQQQLMNNILRKMLKRDEFEESLIIEIKDEDFGKYTRKQFVRNPFYRGKDPLKELFWNKQKADGTKGFVRNPFVPGTEYGYDATTYEKFQQSGFPQTNVDPYWY